MRTNRVAALGVALAFACAGGAFAQKKKGSTKPTSEDKKEGKEELGKGKTVAKADIEAKSASKVKGKATFTDDGKGGITVRIDVSDAPPGEHAVHIHETGDCSAPDAKTAGGHWNPDNMQHGAPDKMPHHAGDLGNITVGADGTGTLTLTLKGTVAGVVGKAVVVHAGQDDLTGQPAGNSGARAACGVIK
jgi:Cu-Zn family superoxide dismutase